MTTLARREMQRRVSSLIFLSTIGALLYHNLLVPFSSSQTSSYANFDFDAEPFPKDGSYHFPSSNSTFLATNADVLVSKIDNSEQNNPGTIQNHRRLFLGIFTDPKADARLRNIIRTTYLDKKFFHYGAPRICSIANVTSDCQVVYAFVASKGNVRKYAVEVDMTFLNSKEATNQVYRFYKYVRRRGTGDNVGYDFVAYTHCRSVLFPDRIWPQDLFHWNSSIYSQQRIYSGFSSTLSNVSRIQDYVLFSKDLLNDIYEDPELQTISSLAETDMILERLVQKASIDVSKEKLPITLPLEESAKIVTDNYYNHFDFIKIWDDYKDEHLVVYEDLEEERKVLANSVRDDYLTKCRHGPRMLLGIMTMKEHDYEGRRRDMIRRTYLSEFNLSQTEKYRICPLHELLDMESSLRLVLLRECQLAYVFVAGGNPHGPKERVELDGQVPMTLPSNESDVVLLNIQENMKEGKTQTFFKYATNVVDDNLYFDYIAKTDSDTLIFPRWLLDRSVNKFPPFPHNVRVYGGYRPAARVEFDHIKGPIYWQGSFYFLSIDMARFITSKNCPRQAVALWSEDKSMCNFVHSHPLPIHRIKLDTSRKAVDHPLKQMQRFIPRWEQYIASNNTR